MEDKETEMLYLILIGASLQVKREWDMIPQTATVGTIHTIHVYLTVRGQGQVINSD